MMPAIQMGQVMTNVIYELHMRSRRSEFPRKIVINEPANARIKNDEKFMERESTSARRISAPDPRHMTAFIICGHMAGVAASFAGDLVRPLGRTRASNRVIWDQRVPMP